MHNRLKHLDNYCLSRYEDVVGKPEKHLRELCHFLEIDFRQDMLCPPIMDSSYDRSQGQIGFDRESIDRWRKYISPISAKLIAMINRKSMRKTGYL